MGAIQSGVGAPLLQLASKAEKPGTHATETRGAPTSSLCGPVKGHQSFYILQGSVQVDNSGRLQDYGPPVDDDANVPACKGDKHFLSASRASRHKPSAAFGTLYFA